VKWILIKFQLSVLCLISYLLYASKTFFFLPSFKREYKVPVVTFCLDSVSVLAVAN